MTHIKVRRRPEVLKHPEFHRDDPSDRRGYWICFERRERQPATKKQLADLKKRTKIVEAHGGVMHTTEYDLGELNPMYTEKDIDELSAFVSKHTGLIENDRWNGAGCYTVSFIFRKRS